MRDPVAIPRLTVRAIAALLVVSVAPGADARGVDTVDASGSVLETTPLVTR